MPDVNPMVYPPMPIMPPWWTWGGPWWPPGPGPTIPPTATRGVTPPTPLSPDGFGNVPGTQPTNGPAPTSPMPAASPLSAVEKDNLRKALEIVKQGRAAIGSGKVSELDTYRMLAAFAYVSGFLEARGYDQLGGFLTTIPTATNASASDLDKFISQADSLITPSDTRIAPVLVALGVSVAGCAIWDGIKWVASKM